MSSLSPLEEAQTSMQGSHGSMPGSCGERVNKGAYAVGEGIRVSAVHGLMLQITDQHGEQFDARLRGQGNSSPSSCSQRGGYASQADAGLVA